MQMAQDWICFYNYARPHFGADMTGKTPIEAVKPYHVLRHPAIASMPVVMLECIVPHINQLLDLTKIPWDYSIRNIQKLNDTMAYYRSLQKIFNI